MSAVWTGMLLNLRIVNVDPELPARVCEKRTGFPSSSQTAAAVSARTGDDTRSPATAMVTSSARLPLRLYNIVTSEVGEVGHDRLKGFRIDHPRLPPPVVASDRTTSRLRGCGNGLITLR